MPYGNARIGSSGGAKTARFRLRLAGALLLLLALLLAAADLHHSAATSNTGNLPQDTGRVLRPVKGLIAADLGDLAPQTAKQIMLRAGQVTQTLQVDLPYILPAGKWNEQTGRPSTDSLMFADSSGLGFDAEALAPDRIEALERQLAAKPHRAASSKSLDALVIHELGHVILSSGLERRPGLEPRVRELIETYRQRLGGHRLRAELGAYAWRGSPDRPERAWEETWAEAFAAVVAGPEGASPHTVKLVWDGLLTLELPAERLLAP